MSHALIFVAICRVHLGLTLKLLKVCQDREVRKENQETKGRQDLMVLDLLREGRLTLSPNHWCLHTNCYLQFLAFHYKMLRLVHTFA